MPTKGVIHLVAADKPKTTACKKIVKPDWKVTTDPSSVTCYTCAVRQSSKIRQQLGLNGVLSIGKSRSPILPFRK